MNNLIIHENKWKWGYSQLLITHNGLATIRIEYINEYPKEANLYGLSVHYSSRMKGYAKEIINIAEQEIIKNDNINQIWLSIENENDFLENFYKKLGYITYKEDEEYKYMVKHLNDNNN